MTRKLSGSDWLLIAFTLMLIVFGIGFSVTITYFGSGYEISAQKITDKPDNYLVLNDPDEYILQAMANNHSSVFKSLDQTQFDELRGENSGRSGFINIEYQGSYYELGLVAVDSTAPFYPLILMGISLAGLVLMVSLKIAQHDKREYQNKAKVISEAKTDWLDCYSRSLS
jgi:hypothetical protein